MSLTDIVSQLDRAWLTEAALVLFLAAFVAIVSRLFRRGHRDAHRAAAAIPLDEPAAHPRTSRRIDDAGLA